MENTTTIALSQLVARQRAMDVSANNLANASTPGYRAERMQFSDWLVREPATADSTALPPGGRLLAYTQDRATYRDLQPGPMTATANPLDLALGAAQGFFTLMTPQGPRLTRAGHFERAPDGSVVDSAGNKLLDTAGRPIQLSTADVAISVSSDGVISSQNGQIGKIGVVAPSDPNTLSAEGNRLFAATSPTSQVATPQISQGMLEQSNVQPILEMVDMMRGQRNFEMTSQMITAESDRQQSAIDKITQRN